MHFLIGFVCAIACAGAVGCGLAPAVIQTSSNGERDTSASSPPPKRQPVEESPPLTCESSESSSTPSSDARLGCLADEQKSQLCDRQAEPTGGRYGNVCPLAQGFKPTWFASKADCIASMTPTCAATVTAFEACMKKDSFQCDAVEQAPECESLRTCLGI